MPHSPARDVALSHTVIMRGTFQGDRLRTLRKERDETQVELADILGVERSFVSKLEKGARPSLETLLAIATHYGVSPDYLLGWSDDRLPRSGGELLKSEDQRAFLTAYAGLPDDVRSGIERVVMGVPRVPTDGTPRRKRHNGS